MAIPRLLVSKQTKARIEIIPLIDVIFFLLATFVLFTLSLNRLQSVPVTLPEPGPPSVIEPASIQASGDGVIYWNGERITIRDVPAMIVNYKKGVSDPKILISGDEYARFGDAIAILDEVRKAGIEKFSVETRIRPPAK